MNAIAQQSGAAPHAEHCNSIEDSNDSTNHEIANEHEAGCLCPTPAWRLEALVRVFPVVVANRYSGTKERDCLVRSDACDPSTGEIIESKNTYDKIRVGGKDYHAHVVVLILINNRFPRRYPDPKLNEVGMHLCNNPACINPRHLAFGTQEENIAFMMLCQRTATEERNGHTTHPEATPRGDTHYRTKVKGEKRHLALKLLKKYGHVRGGPGAIAEFLDTGVYAIENLKRKKEHLLPDVEDTDIVLQITRWVRNREQVKITKPQKNQNVQKMRERFDAADEWERDGLISKFQTEYGYSRPWIRTILKREYAKDIALEIPIPTSLGIFTRNHEKPTTGVDE